MPLSNAQTVDQSPQIAGEMRLLAELSHELRTPLAALLGYVELLLDPPAAPPSPDTTQQMLRIVQASGEHALGLVQNVLDWARVDATSVPRLQAVSPRKICQDAIAWMTPRLASTAVSLRCAVQPTTPHTVLTDPARLRQILLNLLANALKFTTLGEVRIELSGIIDVAGQHMLRIDVSDTGIGISEVQMSQLFTPFLPGDGVHHEHFGGTGLGLAISLRLCESLGGRITVHSRPGNGSTFRVELPVGEADEGNGSTTAESEIELPDSPPAQSLLGCRVLLADDSLETRRLAALILRQAGAEVTDVAGGREAVALAVTAWRRSWLGAVGRLRPFDVVLLDLQMPVCDGYTAVRELTATGYPGPIIALTAAAGAHVRDACTAAGFCAVATKPINRRALVDTVCHWRLQRLCERSR